VLVMTGWVKAVIADGSSCKQDRHRVAAMPRGEAGQSSWIDAGGG
jgi:hypothetical protein